MDLRTWADGRVPDWCLRVQILTQYFGTLAAFGSRWQKVSPLISTQTHNEVPTWGLQKGPVDPKEGVDSTA